MERNCYEFGEFRLDTRAGVLFRSGNPVPLRPKTVETLRVLVERNGAVVSRQELLEQVWPGSFVEENGIARNICDLRKTLNDGNGTVLIETIPKRGYRFAAAVNIVEAPFVPVARRVAVIPFMKLGRNGPDDDFRLRLADSLIARLESLRSCCVVPSAEMQGFLADCRDPVPAGRRLNAEYVIAGNVQKSQQAMRVGVRLLDVRSGKSIWAESLDEAGGDLHNLELSLAEEIAGAVALKLTAGERKLLDRRYTNDARAYQLYLRGRYHWQQRSAEGFRRAVVLFERAIKRDPEYAPAFSGLADCYAMLPMMASLPPRRYMPRAKAAALNALDIDPTLVEARASLAFVKWHYDWNWSGAEREFKRLLQVHPEHVLTRQWYALLLAEVGRKSEAVAQAHTAFTLAPDSIAIRANLATVLHLTGCDEEAVTEARQTLASDPNCIRALWTLGLGLEQLGHFDEALVHLRQGVELSHGMPAALGALGHVYAKIGNTTEAQDILSKLQAIPGAAYSRALVHLALGARTTALQCLEDACDERSFHTVLLKADRRLHPLRSGSRFKHLLKCVRLS